MTTTENNPKALFVTARKWFNKGNTYHTVEIWHPSGKEHQSGMVYGYDNQWETTALEIINRHIHPGADRYNRLWQFAEGEGYSIGTSVTQVCRKRDL